GFLPPLSGGEGVGHALGPLLVGHQRGEGLVAERQGAFAKTVAEPHPTLLGPRCVECWRGFRRVRPSRTAARPASWLLPRRAQTSRCRGYRGSRARLGAGARRRRLRPPL